MIKKAKEFFSRSAQKVEDNPTLFQLREQAIRKTYSQKLNFNLVFNPSEYKSQQDNSVVLEKRKSNTEKVIGEQVIDSKELKRCSWNGVQSNRAFIWKVLLGYLSGHRELHSDEQKQHLRKYQDLHKVQDVEKCGSKRLIEIDIPRTFFEIEILFSDKRVQRMLSRVLCMWDMTGEGYTQGMGDIAGLLLMVLTKYDEDPKLTWFKQLGEQQFQMLQADLYWLSRTVCSKFFGYYNITNSKGIEGIMNRIQKIIEKSDVYLSQHLKHHNITIFQFAFRWIYVLLSREIPIRLVFRLMDSYFSASQDFEILHSYVVASLILRFSVLLLKINSFHGLMSKLQKLPTEDWTKKDIEMLVEEAVVLMHTYSNTL